MTLQDINISSTYSSEESDLLNDFYIPALAKAIKYDRAVGYFSAGMLAIAGKGLSSFVNNKGTMRLLIGEPLDLEEYQAVIRGYELQKFHERITKKINLILENTEHPLFRNQLELLSWLIASERLEIKIALTIRGIYHEKIGILTDNKGEQLVFQGSANETVAALSPDFNFESISVYPSWKQEIFHSYGLPYIQRFERLWNGNANGIKTIPLPSEAYEAFKNYYGKEKPPKAIENNNRQGLIDILSKESPFPQLPSYLGDSPYKALPHQIDALKEWKASDYRGIFALATGAGKTITALHGATQLWRGHAALNRSLVLIISVPYQVLADQWCAVMQSFNMHPIRCYRSREYWKLELEEKISNLKLSRQARFLCAVVVDATLARDDFQNAISKVEEHELMFVGDECHHHASNKIAGRLPNARYRLGLSATPWTPSETERKEALKGYYGPIVSSYSLKDALAHDVLCPYEYHVHSVTMNEVEAEQYEEISDQIAKLYAMKEQGVSVNEDVLTQLYMKRGRIIGSLEDKFSTLRELLSGHKVGQHTLFYCGDGSTEDDSEDSERDIERVSKTLGISGWKTSQFTARESHNERERIMENFKFGYIDAVIAIRVLDEGFDMPACRQAFLMASSRSDRQFIQRRGRILRKSVNKEQAVIHDFMVSPGLGNTSSAFSSLVRKELMRTIEFARFSINMEDNKKVLNDIALNYGHNYDELLIDVELREVTKDEQ